MRKKNKWKLLDFLAYLSSYLFEPGEIKNKPLKESFWSTFFKTIVHLQFVFNLLWLDSKIYSTDYSGTCLFLGVSSTLLEVSTKLVIFNKKLSKKGRLLICILKLCNTILVKVLFIIGFTEVFEGMKVVKTQLIFNLQTNYVLTMINLSLGYLRWHYIIAMFFLTYVIVYSMIFQNKELISVADCTSAQFLDEYYNISISVSNLLSIIVMYLIFKSMYNKRDLFQQMLKSSPIGQAILQRGKKDIEISNETFYKILKKRGLQMNFENLSLCSFDRVMKLSEHSNFQTQISENLSPRSGKSPFRMKINFSQIMESLKRAPRNSVTVYTKLTLNNKESGFEKSPNFDFEQKSANLHTERNLLESEHPQYEMKVSFLNWSKYKDKYYYIQLNDISELQKRMEVERQTEFKTRILHSFSHELITPINISKNMCDLMIMEKEASEMMKEKYASVIYESVYHLDMLIQDIVDFLKLESSQFHLDPSKFCLRQLLEECINSILKRSELHDIQIFLNSDKKEEHIVFTDRNRLKRILLNVLNFVIAVNRNCKLELSLKVNKPGNCDFLLKKLSPTKASVSEDFKAILSKNCAINTLSVRPDNNFGIMISKILLEKLKTKGIDSYSLNHKDNFGRILEFTTSSFPNDSPPLSLEPSIMDIEKYNSHEDDCFALRREKKFLNYYTQKKFQSQAPTKPKIVKSYSNAIVLSPKCPRVLIVDDDYFNLLTISLLLQKLDIYSIKAANGLEAISSLTKHLKDHNCLSEACKGIELILMDLMMPKMNGLECSKALIKMMKEGEIPHIPIVACTANDSQDILELCSQAGLKEVLPKPISLETLRSVVAPYLLS